MKLLTGILFLSISLNTKAQSVLLPDDEGKMTDVSELSLSKEILFKKMDRDFIKLGQSICSNRALMWAYDFQKKYDIRAGKIFLFYTKKTGDVGRKTWWYHVSPMIAEKGNSYVMDAGFPGHINGPLSKNEWLKKFTGSTNCKEIKAEDDDLFQRMYRGQVFPQETRHGNYDCYYRLTGPGLWTPASIAMNALGVDYEGNPVRFERPKINEDEVYTACKEAVTTPVGRIFGTGVKKCRKFIER